MEFENEPLALPATTSTSDDAKLQEIINAYLRQFIAEGHLEECFIAVGCICHLPRSQRLVRLRRYEDVDTRGRT